MTTKEKLLVMQAAAFAREFVKEADLASLGRPNQLHLAASELRAALSEIPAAIDNCACDCVSFMEVRRG